jgi:hypothetical protein
MAENEGKENTRGSTKSSSSDGQCPLISLLRGGAVGYWVIAWLPRKYMAILIKTSTELLNNIKLYCPCFFLLQILLWQFDKILPIS